MPNENLEIILLTKDEALLTACRARFAESRVNITPARDSNGFKSTLREKNIAAVILDSAYTYGIWGLTPEEAVVKFSPLLAPRVLMVLTDQFIPPAQVVKLLKLGAHDVVPKPVKPRLLAEQLKALVRIFSRKKKQDKKILSAAADALIMDYPRRRCYIKEEAAGRLFSSKKEIKLTKIEFQVLYFLLQKKGGVITLFGDGPCSKGGRYAVHIVRKGETMAEIAIKYYKDMTKWEKIWGANPQIPNPHRLEKGMKLLIPLD
ncbi:MAG: hypothetical protein COX65_10440 [Elusimicrobia bacterium CG_4_10_14_0_2_um_filter_56_8]|nr:MAG: hypothetical protein COX65_10440 [Elusimicrobia bacterium CG_4_10_14_0_2_um_filter_56_8]